MQKEDCTLVETPSTTDIQEKIEKIIRQTNYTETVAREKLLEFQFDELLVIKNYFGITDKKVVKTANTSLNQEIYRQLRTKMNASKIPQSMLPTV
jgi:hypothetical protein